MTPRSTTCTPRYAWMPAITRLAVNAGSRNCKMSQCMMLCPALHAGRLERGQQRLDVVVEELKVVVHWRSLGAADRRGQRDHLGARVAADGVRRLRVEVRLDDD